MRRPWLLPLVPVYRAALWLKQRAVENRAGYQRRLAWPVVSVGSLSAGGAGKTPVVAALAGLLGRAGYEVDVLSRGYGRGADTVEQVDPGVGSPGDPAARFGDEPLLLARLTGAPVYVGADRYEAGLLAEREAEARGRWVHLLDDGFQHRRLERVLDVVLLTRRDVEDWLLPAGNLREPLGRLREAGAVVVREEEAEELRPVVQRLASAEMPVWVVRRTLDLPARGATERSRRVLAFCGIARPDGFVSMLSSAGMEVAETMAFRDHHRYRERDVARLVKAARRLGTDAFVTTEKDSVKLSARMRERLEVVGPVLVAGLSVTFVDEPGVLAGIAVAIAPG